MVFLPRHRAALLSKISVWVIVDPIVAFGSNKIASWKSIARRPPFQNGFRGEPTQG